MILSSAQAQRLLVQSGQERAGDFQRPQQLEKKQSTEPFPQSVKEWDEHITAQYIPVDQAAPQTQPKTGKELDTRLTNFKSLLAHLNSSNDKELLAGLKAFRYSTEKLKCFYKKTFVDKGFFEKSIYLKKMTTDALHKYMEKSPEFIEILTIWEKHHENVDINMSVVDLLGSVYSCLKLMVVSKELSINIQSISCKILHKEKIITTNLTSGNALLTKSTLRMLSNMVNFSPAVAREVLSSYNLSANAVLKLVSIKQAEIGSDFNGDVRTWYIRLALSFLRTESGPIISEVLGLRGFIDNIFLRDSGLANDNTELVKEVIDTFHGVLHNEVVHKKTKVAFFTSAIMENIAETWNLIEKYKKFKMVKFIRTLCSTNYGVGDKFGNNLIFLKFMYKLNPERYQHQGEIILSIMKNSNSRVREIYLSKLPINLTPINSLPWLLNITFMGKLIDLEYNKMAEFIATPTITDAEDTVPAASQTTAEITRVPNRVIPLPLNVGILNSGITSDTKLVVFSMLRILYKLVMNVKKWLEMKKASSDNIEKFRALALAQLPHVSAIREVRTKFMNDKTAPLIYKLSTRVLSEYFHIFPNLATSGRFLFGKYLDPNISEQTPLVQYELLRFMKEHREHLEWSTQVGSAPLLYHLLKLQAKKDVEEISSISTELIVDLLNSTGYFLSITEISAWLVSLDSEDSSNFFMSTLERLKSITEISDYASELATSAENFKASRTDLTPISVSSELSLFLVSCFVNLTKPKVQKQQKKDDVETPTKLSAKILFLARASALLVSSRIIDCTRLLNAFRKALVDVQHGEYPETEKEEALERLGQIVNYFITLFDVKTQKASVGSDPVSIFPAPGPDTALVAQALPHVIFPYLTATSGEVSEIPLESQCVLSELTEAVVEKARALSLENGNTILPKTLSNAYGINFDAQSLVFYAEMLSHRYEAVPAQDKATRGVLLQVIHFLFYLLNQVTFNDNRLKTSGVSFKSFSLELLSAILSHPVAAHYYLSGSSEISSVWTYHISILTKKLLRARNARKDGTGPEALFFGKILNVFRNFGADKQNKDITVLSSACEILGMFKNYVDATDYTTCVKILLEFLDNTTPERRSTISKLLSSVLENKLGVASKDSSISLLSWTGVPKSLVAKKQDALGSIGTGLDFSADSNFLTVFVNYMIQNSGEGSLNLDRIMMDSIVLSPFYHNSLVLSSAHPITDIAAAPKDVLDADKLFKYLYSPSASESSKNKPVNAGEKGVTLFRATSLAALVWAHPKYESMFSTNFVKDVKKLKSPKLDETRFEFLAPVLSVLQKDQSNSEIIQSVAKVFFVPLVQFLISGASPQLVEATKGYGKAIGDYITHYGTQILEILLNSRDARKIVSENLSKIFGDIKAKVLSKVELWSVHQISLIVDLLATFGKNSDNDGDVDMSDAEQPSEHEPQFKKLATVLFFKLLGFLSADAKSSSEPKAMDVEVGKKRKASEVDGTTDETPAKRAKSSVGGDVDLRPNFKPLQLRSVEVLVTKLLTIDYLVQETNKSAPKFGKLIQAPFSILQLRLLHKMVNANAIKPEALHHFLLTHQELLPTLMSPTQAQPPQFGVIPNNSVKFAIVALFFKIYRQNQALCSPALLPYLFSLYTARTNFFDRLLLALFFLYDNAGVDILEGTGYLWGSHAQEHLKKKASGEDENALDICENLFLEARMLDPVVIQNTIQKFALLASYPLSIEPSHFDQYLEDFFVNQKTSMSRKEIDFFSGDIYDLSFLLPFFHFAMENFDTFTPRKFVHNSGFQLSVLSLSLQTADIRSTAYDILASFSTKLEKELQESGSSAISFRGPKISGSSANFSIKNGSQIKLVLNSLKNGITQSNQKIPGIITHFVSEMASQVMLRPDHWMYSPANDFFLRKPFLELSEIPMFHTLFNSAKVDSYLRERSFILQIMAGGILDTDDTQMCQKKKIFASLTAFADSGISDLRTRQLVFDVISALVTASTPTAASSQTLSFASPAFFFSTGLASWLHHRLLDLESTLQLLHTHSHAPSSAPSFIPLSLSLLIPLFSLTVSLHSPSYSLPYSLLSHLIPFSSSLISFSLLFLTTTETQSSTTNETTSTTSSTASHKSKSPATLLPFFSQEPSFSAFSEILTSLAPSHSVPFLYLTTSLHLLNVIQSKSRVSSVPPSSLLLLVQKTLEFFNISEPNSVLYLEAQQIPVQPQHRMEKQKLVSLLISVITAATCNDQIFGERGNSGSGTELEALSRLIVWSLDSEIRNVRSKSDTGSEDDLKKTLSWIMNTLFKTGQKNPKFWKQLQQLRFPAHLRLLYIWFQPTSNASGSPSLALLLNMTTLLYLQNTVEDTTREEFSKVIQKASVQQILALPAGFTESIPENISEVESQQPEVSLLLRQLLN